MAPKFSGPEGEPRPASLVPKVDYPLDGGRILRIEGQIRLVNFRVPLYVRARKKSCLVVKDR